MAFTPKTQHRAPCRVAPCASILYAHTDLLLNNLFVIVGVLCLTGAHCKLINTHVLPIFCTVCGGLGVGGSCPCVPSIGRQQGRVEDIFYPGAVPGILQRGGGGPGSSQRHVPKNLQNDKQKRKFRSGSRNWDPGSRIQEFVRGPI